MLELALDLSRKAAGVLKERGIENARLESELMLADVLGIDRLKLYLQHDRPVTPDELERFRAHVRRRMKREPLQYILGTIPFREITLKTDARALIPRPETELLAGEVVKWLRARSATGDGAESGSATAEVMSRARVLDIGTGTGAIALSVAHETGCIVIATDVSRDALSLAAENAAATGLAGRVELRHGPTWEPIAPGEVFDVVVSNPPYIDEADRASLAPEVVAWEPEAALFAQGAGLAVLSAIIEGAPGHLRAGGLLALEIGAAQGAAVSAAVAATGCYGALRVLKDLAGRDRMVLAETVHDDN